MKYSDMEKNLFTAGPTNSIHSDRVADSVYMRTDDFRVFTKSLVNSLGYLIDAPNVVLVSSSGTGVMQMAVDNFLYGDRNALILGDGRFSIRWKDIIDKKFTDKEVTILSPSKDNLPTLDEVEEFYESSDKKYDVVFMTLCESSTGELQQSIKEITKVVHQNGGMVVLDAISGLMVNPFSMHDTRVDVVVSTTSKGFNVAPGLSMIAYTDEALRDANSSSYYFDLKLYDKEIKRGSTPFTPPVTIMRDLDLSVDDYLENSKDKIMNNIQCTKRIRDKMKSLGYMITVDESKLGNCITQFMIKDVLSIDSYTLCSILRARGYEIVPDGEFFIRIGNYNKTYEEIVEFLNEIEFITIKYKKV